MKDMATMAGKLMPPAVAKQTLSSNKGTNQTTSQEMDCPHSYRDKSPPKKKKAHSEASTLKSAGSFDATVAGARREISMLLTNFTDLLRERAAADTTQMKELEGILTEARNLESYLKDKKCNLRQSLALISNKLQS
ncbi:hypothetical protein CCH79_00019744, partial [Gambusia affinis]